MKTEQTLEQARELGRTYAHRAHEDWHKYDSPVSVYRNDLGFALKSQGLIYHNVSHGFDEDQKVITECERVYHATLQELGHDLSHDKFFRLGVAVLNYWKSFEEDDDINGGDLVEFIDMQLQRLEMRTTTLDTGE